MEIKHVKDSLGGGVVGQVSHDLSMNQSHSRTGVICFHHPQVYDSLKDPPRESKAQEGQLGLNCLGQYPESKNNAILLPYKDLLVAILI